MFIIIGVTIVVVGGVIMIFTIPPNAFKDTPTKSITNEETKIVYNVTEKYTNWGFSTWNCGNEYFTLNLHESNASLERITGFVSASEMPQATNLHYVRESLSTLYLYGQNNSQTVEQDVTGDDPARTTASSDQNLFSMDIKQKYHNSFVVPVDTTFNKPISIPDGKIYAAIDTQTYDGITSITGNPGECLATELHLTIFYHTIP